MSNAGGWGKGGGEELLRGREDVEVLNWPLHKMQEIQ